MPGRRRKLAAAPVGARHGAGTPFPWAACLPRRARPAPQCRGRRRCAAGAAPVVRSSGSSYRGGSLLLDEQLHLFAGGARRIAQSARKRSNSIPAGRRRRPSPHRASCITRRAPGPAGASMRQCRHPLALRAAAGRGRIAGQARACPRSHACSSRSAAPACSCCSSAERSPIRNSRSTSCVATRIVSAPAGAAGMPVASGAAVGPRRRQAGSGGATVGGGAAASVSAAGIPSASARRLDHRLGVPGRLPRADLPGAVGSHPAVERLIEQRGRSVGCRHRAQQILERVGHPAHQIRPTICAEPLMLWACRNTSSTSAASAHAGRSRPSFRACRRSRVSAGRLDEEDQSKLMPTSSAFWKATGGTPQIDGNLGRSW